MTRDRPRAPPFGLRREGCSVARTLEVLGERWTLLVLREAFYGVRRFDDLLTAIGCARNLLSDRLAKLCEHGVLARVPYREEGQRERFEYRLTEKGHEIFPILIALLQWGDRWLAGAEGPPVEVRHRECGALVCAELRCEQGHRPLTARDTEPRLPARASRRRAAARAPRPIPGRAARAAR